MLGANIDSWRPENRALLSSEWAVVLLCVVLDMQLLGRYARSAMAAAQRRHYGALNLIVHFVAGAAMVILGPLGLALQAMAPGAPWLCQRAATFAACATAWGALASAVGVAGMSRHTQGHQGYIMLCYNEYALIWAWAAVHVLKSPTPHALYVCWVLGHAYAACRICVATIKPAPVSFKWAYTLGTLIASCATILVALPHAVAAPLLVCYLGIPLILGGPAAPMHKHYKSGSEFSPFAHYLPTAFRTVKLL